MLGLFFIKLPNFFSSRVDSSHTFFPKSSELFAELKSYNLDLLKILAQLLRSSKTRLEKFLLFKMTTQRRKPPVSQRRSTLAKQVQLCILHVFTLEVQHTKHFESGRSAERMIHVVKDSNLPGPSLVQLPGFPGFKLQHPAWRSCTATRQMLSRELPALGIGVD